MATDVASTIKATIEPEKLKLFDTRDVSALNGVRVFDVGQGDCIGLLDQNDKIFCYFDYGGLGDHPDKRNPTHTPLRIPVKYGSGYASIILSHWDKDHYWSAVKKNPETQRCPWIVPRQHVSPQATRFAATLSDAKCWPEDVGQQAFAFAIGSEFELQIRKCDRFDATANHEDRNVTGLAVSLHWRDAYLPDIAIVLPGDCAFDRIPSFPADPIRALVAYHHGSASHWTGATTQAISNAHTTYKLVYSFGQNSFGHPDTSNYSSCLPDWNYGSVATQSARMLGAEYCDIGW